MKPLTVNLIALVIALAVFVFVPSFFPGTLFVSPLVEATAFGLSAIAFIATRWLLAMGR